MDYETFKNWLQISDLTKSAIISQCAHIEHLMTGHLAIRFSQKPEEIKKILKVFFETNRITFHGLITLYRQYLNEFESNWIKENPDFIAKLEKLKTLRNEFAHAINPLPEDLEKIENFRKTSVVIIRYRNGEKEIIAYPHADIIKITSDLDYLGDCLESLLLIVANLKGFQKQDIINYIDTQNDLVRPNNT